MKPPNAPAALAAAITAARQAGELLRANWHRPKRVHANEAHDLKLELDTRCQKTIERSLRRAFPGIPVLGEEGVSGDPDAEDRWVVDPIDGTVNYFYGLPHAAVSIALEHRRQSVAAVILDPFTGELWTATRGGVTRLNGRVVRVSERTRLADTVIAMGFSKDKENLDHSLPHFLRLARRVKKIRVLGSAALELAYVACGRLDAYIERRIYLWDIAAGRLLVECAGGEVLARPVAGGHRYAMCADNGRLRAKLQVSGLLK